MKNYQIRKTDLSDNNLFYTIRNEKKNRTNSLNSKKIDKEDHTKWFKENYKNKYYFTCLKGKSKIGYIRGDIVGETIQISIGLKTQNQNKNIGTHLFNLFEKKIKNNIIFIAKVNKKNSISKRFFLKNGFNELNKIGDKIIYYKIKNNSSKVFLDIINKIENVRRKNNSNWMNILRIAFKNSPKETSKIFKEIHNSDGQINNLSKKLS